MGTALPRSTMVLTIKEETVPPWDYRGALSPGTGPDLPGWPAAAPSWVRVPLYWPQGETR